MGICFRHYYLVANASQQKQRDILRGNTMVVCGRKLSHVVRFPHVFPSLHFPTETLLTMASTDRDALVALFRSTGGSSWKKKDNWNTGAELLRWHGVKVNNQGRVVGITLYSNNLRGM